MGGRARTRGRGFGIRADHSTLQATGHGQLPDTRPPAAELLLARVHLGELIRNRRDELRLKTKEIAGRLGWTTQFYGEIEKGFKSSPDVRSWVLIADMLQLDSVRLLEQVWDTRESMSVPLPAKTDSRRSGFLRMVVDTCV